MTEPTLEQRFDRLDDAATLDLLAKQRQQIENLSLANGRLTALVIHYERGCRCCKGSTPFGPSELEQERQGAPTLAANYDRALARLASYREATEYLGTWTCIDWSQPGHATLLFSLLDGDELDKDAERLVYHANLYDDLAADLLALEWQEIGLFDGQPRARCPVCLGRRDPVETIDRPGFQANLGHASDCKLAQIIERLVAED